MNAAHWHLLIVHLPVVGTLSGLVLLVLGLVLKQPILGRVACGFFVVNAVLAAVAYYTGEPAAEVLEASGWQAEGVEAHALIARITFVGMIVLGMMAVQLFLEYGRDEPPARWLLYGLLILVVVLCYLLAWTSHLGGLIHHPEIREPHLWWFPEVR